MTRIDQVKELEAIRTEVSGLVKTMAQLQFRVHVLQLKNTNIWKIVNLMSMGAEVLLNSVEKEMRGGK